MAAEKQKSSSAVRRLTPNAIDVKVDGKDIRVATNREENAILNMIMASQIRALIQESIKKYGEDDNKLTPKEIADLAKAAKDIAQFSAEVYAGTVIDQPSTEKKAEKAAEQEVDFDDIKATEVKP